MSDSLQDQQIYCIVPLRSIIEIFVRLALQYIQWFLIDFQTLRTFA
jgi:hypothetical protein